MNTRLALLLLCLCSTLAAQTTAIKNARLTGNLEAKSGAVVQIESGATLQVEVGGLFDFDQPLSLAAGGLGVGLADPGGDRIVFWDESGNVVGWLTIGDGLQIVGTTLSSTAEAFENPMTTLGDLIVGGASGALGRLGVGSNGQVLSVVSGAPAWAAAFSNPMTTAGDLIVGGTSGAPGRLGIGTDGQVLKVSGGAVAWGSDSTGAGSLPATPEAGDMSYFDGTDWIELDIGTAGQVLKVNSGATAPEWGVAAASGTKTLVQWTPLGNQPPASNYATFATRNSIAVLVFNASTAQSANFVGWIPEGASLGSGVQVRIAWITTSSTTGDCVWRASIERGLTDLDSDSFATAVDVTTAASATSGIPITSAISLDSSAEMDSVAAGDFFRLRITRQAADGADTTGEVQLLAVELRSL